MLLDTLKMPRFRSGKLPERESQLVRYLRRRIFFKVVVEGKGYIQSWSEREILSKGVKVRLVEKDYRF